MITCLIINVEILQFNTVLWLLFEIKFRFILFFTVCDKYSSCITKLSYCMRLEMGTANIRDCMDIETMDVKSTGKMLQSISYAIVILAIFLHAP